MPPSIRIGSSVIGDSDRCFIIAEAGVNHNGSLNFAKKLIDAAADAGACAVKFQTYKTDSLIIDDIEKATYQKVTTKLTESQTEMLKRLEIDRDFHKELIEHCNKKNIMFLSTCYDQESLELLAGFDVPAIKIASTDTTNLLFLEQIAKKAMPVILSTGMCSESEIEQAYNCLKENGCADLIMLKCTSSYPTKSSDVNLKAMLTLNKKFDAIIGFSDHTEGVGASPYAVALGAKVVEKHFTLDKNLPGPDHQASLSPDELALWVQEIRKVEQMLGRDEILPTEGEKETKRSLQKCLVSRTNLGVGDRITRDKLAAKRTGGAGISALELYKVLGKKVQNSIEVNRPISWKDLQVEE